MITKMEIDGLYRIIPLKSMRRTPNVDFDCVPSEIVSQTAAIDKVKHGTSAFSPGPIGDEERPWYMHPHQVDHLIVMQGVRTVDLFAAGRDSICTLVITPDQISIEGEVVYEGAAIVSWPTGVFHRIISGEGGSNSINFASHLDGFDIRTNFNIYSLNTETSEYSVIREGHLDQ